MSERSPALAGATGLQLPRAFPPREASGEKLQAERGIFNTGEAETGQPRQARIWSSAACYLSRRRSWLDAATARHAGDIVACHGEAHHMRNLVSPPALSSPVSTSQLNTRGCSCRVIAFRSNSWRMAKLAPRPACAACDHKLQRATFTYPRRRFGR